MITRLTDTAQQSPTLQIVDFFFNAYNKLLHQIHMNIYERTVKAGKIFINSWSDAPTEKNNTNLSAIITDGLKNAQLVR